MAIIQSRPLTPGQRFLTKISGQLSSTRNKPERKLLCARIRSCGRNCYGRITSRRRGGGHKRLDRIVDFRRDKFDIPAVVRAIEYDPTRSANIALLSYKDGEKRYILATKDMRVGNIIYSRNSKTDDFSDGTAMQLKFIPQGVFVHSVEIEPGSGAKLARAAGMSAQLVAIENSLATLKMPSGEIRYLHTNCMATIGVVGNEEHSKRSLGKAGRNRWLGRRPRVRGVAMNPVDHPMGGGEGRTSGGGHPVSPWGQLAKGKPTRKRTKTSNAMILVRRNGKKMRKESKG
ncbi:MAG: 50S ribosomal protein L2 [Puniceicoccales bacterium]|nr:50S ribosomal protein L2 [Puniceicoccales bacterium]